MCNTVLRAHTMYRIIWPRWQVSSILQFWFHCFSITLKAERNFQHYEFQSYRSCPKSSTCLSEYQKREKISIRLISLVDERSINPDFLTFQKESSPTNYAHANELKSYPIFQLIVDNWIVIHLWPLFESYINLFIVWRPERDVILLLSIN